LINTFYDNSATVKCVRFHPDGTMVASSSVDGSLKMWDIRSSKLLQHYDAHENEITHIDFHPSGNFLISSSKDSSVRVWDLTMGQQLYTIRGHDKSTTCVCFNPAGDHFASTSEDGLVLVWKTNFDKILQSLPKSGRKSEVGEAQVEMRKPSPAK